MKGKMKHEMKMSDGSLRLACVIFILDERQSMPYCVAAVGLLSEF